MNKIQVGYGSDRRGCSKKGLYGGRTGGKKLTNGGFNGLPTVDFARVTDNQWEQAFGKAGVPWYERDDRYKG